MSSIGNSAGVLADYMTTEELAIELNRSPRTIQRWHRQRVGPPATILQRRILYRRSSVLKWLEAREWEQA